eukprot:PhF_6_TR13404/c0_g1_i1/m.21324
MNGRLTIRFIPFLLLSALFSTSEAKSYKQPYDDYSLIYVPLGYLNYLTTSKSVTTAVIRGASSVSKCVPINTQPCDCGVKTVTIEFPHYLKLTSCAVDNGTSLTVMVTIPAAPTNFVTLTSTGVSVLFTSIECFGYFYTAAPDGVMRTNYCVYGSTVYEPRCNCYHSTVTQQRILQPSTLKTSCDQILVMNATYRCPMSCTRSKTRKRIRRRSLSLTSRTEMGTTSKTPDFQNTTRRTRSITNDPSASLTLPLTRSVTDACSIAVEIGRTIPERVLIDVYGTENAVIRFRLALNMWRTTITPRDIAKWVKPSPREAPDSVNLNRVQDVVSKGTLSFSDDEQAFTLEIQPDWLIHMKGPIELDVWVPISSNDTLQFPCKATVTTPPRITLQPSYLDSPTRAHVAMINVAAILAIVSALTSRTSFSTIADVQTSMMLLSTTCMSYDGHYVGLFSSWVLSPLSVIYGIRDSAVYATLSLFNAGVVFGVWFLHRIALAIMYRMKKRHYEDTAVLLYEPNVALFFAVHLYPGAMLTAWKAIYNYSQTRYLFIPVAVVTTFGIVFPFRCYSIVRHAQYRYKAYYRRFPNSEDSLTYYDLWRYLVSSKGIWTPPDVIARYGTLFSYFTARAPWYSVVVLAYWFCLSITLGVNSKSAEECRVKLPFVTAVHSTFTGVSALCWPYQTIALNVLSIFVLATQLLAIVTLQFM